MRVNYHIWSGFHRLPNRANTATCSFPTLIIDVALNDWALPLSVHKGGPLLGRSGFTLRIGPINIGWSKL